MNPIFSHRLEVRWRDAPGSFLPADSPFWKRQPDGSRVLMLHLPPEGYVWLVASLALGTPALSVIGTFGAALTVGVASAGLFGSKP